MTERVLRGKPRRCYWRLPLFLLGLLALIWFMIPLYVRIINIGNLTGMVVSVLLMGIALFFPQLKRLVKRMYQGTIGRIVVILVAVIAAAAVLSAGVLTGFMIRAANQTPPADATVVVLGCKVNGTTPSLMLTRRLEAAQAYLEKNPDAKCIVSGGQGPDEGVSEAQAMQTWLTAHGIDAQRIYMEDESTNTEENMAFSKRIMQQNGLSEQVAIVTDGFHQLRASLIAQDQYITPYSVPADTPWFTFSAYYVRELYALVEQIILK